MKNYSRTQNAMLNVAVGYICQIGMLLLSLWSRSLFLRYLSIEYLGINGLYTNILSVLSLAELGLGNVAVFALYKPVADGNIPLINSLVKYLKRVYFTIAITVLTIGLLLIPFLKYIIKSDLSTRDLTLYYILFLLSTVVTYLVGHKVALICAYQENRLQKTIELVKSFIVQILHIIILIFFPNYTVYVLISVICAYIGNGILNYITNKKYSYLKRQDECVDITKEKARIKKDILSTALYKFGTVFINNTDNILISMIAGINVVGLYSNYYTIVIALQGFISIIATTLVNGIGNLNTENDARRMNSTFNIMLYIFHFIAAYGGICLFLLFNQFIPIWLGKEYTLDMYTVFIISFNFYLTNAISPVWMYREATGMFSKVKYLMLITALLNIILSILLGIYWGIFGILVASALSRILSSFWYEPQLLYKNVFYISTFQYWKRQGIYFLGTAFSCIICWYISVLVPKTFIFIIFQGVAYFIICIIVFFIIDVILKDFILREIVSRCRILNLKKI